MRVDIDDTEQEDGFTYTYRGETFTGEVVELDADGTVVELIEVVNGVPHGIERAWYPDRTLRLETRIVAGWAVGTSRYWHPNGTLAEERDFDDRGNLVAIRRWDQSGQPVN
jgi:antitoxin component YwqK of YwqJK toxin-antitoxin module